MAHEFNARIPFGTAMPLRKHYIRALAWAFALFNSVRVFAYVPTLLAIHSSGDSSQHSVFTWCTWLGANLTMAAWLYESGDQRISKPVAVNLCNAAMCGATLAVICWYRL